MAVLALFAVQLVVCIIAAMATVTVTWSVVMLFRNPVIVCMAIIAGLLPMPSLELVPGILIMIEY
jgi:fumarate reductase subunit C